ncbi:MAG: PEGA domain-containing protein [Treponema sp.]|nr:PEGA domain-containing protein [Treponema sp.]
MIRRCLPGILFFCAVFFLYPDTYNEVSGSGLFLDSFPSGAKVFIDGVERGTTPYSSSSIRSGEYSIRIYKEGYTERRFSVVIRRDSRVEVIVDMKEAKGQVLLELTRDPAVPSSLPFNPRISADGSYLSAEDITVTASAHQQNVTLPAGWRTVTVDAFGWERVSRRIYVEDDGIQKLELLLKRAEFILTNASLKKTRFNPKNSGILGTVEINFMVSAPGLGLLEVLDANGAVIHERDLGPFTGWQQQAAWNGRNRDGEPVGDGTYLLRLSAWDEETNDRQSAEFPVLADSSIIMRPLTMVSSSSGLLLVPSPEALPAFSYQIEGNLLAGRPLLREAWESLPFAVGLRVSFLDNLEAAAVFNAAPGFSGGTEWGIGASIKWIFFHPRKGFSGFADALGMAAVLSYGWATAGPYTAFGMGTGAALRLPMMYRPVSGETAKRGNYSFDLLLSPFFLWAGEKGYPDSIIPRLGMEGGALFTHGNIAAGLSLRWDYVPEEGSSGPLVSALEFKFFPSSFVVSLTGGFWYLPDGKQGGAFFGAGLGIMY